jgi:hypothetical protein
MNVDLHHAGQHRGEWNARLFSHPVAGVMDDGAQAAGGVVFYRFGEGQYLLIGTKIGGKTDSSGVAQCVNGRVVRAIADDNRLLLIQKMVRQRKADAAASTGDENRARLSDSHGYLL